MASRFLADELPASVAVGDDVELTGDEGRHAATVTRLRVGEQVGVGDGRGLVVHGTVTAVAKASVVVRADAVAREQRASPELWLVQALAKGDRDELAVQAATELGVAGVVPWSAERSVSRWDAAKAAKGEQRWRSIVREASKQSLRAWVPEVAPLASTAELVAATAEPGTLLAVLEPTAATPLSALELGRAERIHLVVGPEGGVATAELTRFADAGAHLVRLGAEVLRTSTAGPAALAVLNARLGRW